MNSLAARRDYEPRSLSAGLDFYKPTMSQFAYENEPSAEVTFTFKNRGRQILKDYVDPLALQARFDSLAQRGFSQAELSYFAEMLRADGNPLFSESYIDFLVDNPLPAVKVEAEQEDIEISTNGPWPLVTFWETVVMSEINEAYFEGYVRAHGINLTELYAEGDRRLSKKIAYLQAHPEIKIAEFGTRRRFSLKWQQHVLERLKNECPGNLIGTSNVALARAAELKPIGTFAHEMPMVYAALSDARGQDIRASHGRMLDDWNDLYQDELSVALSDTFGSDVFFEDLGYERAIAWQSTRHDSGDPLEYGEKAIAFYEAHGIDSRHKTIVFSDGLDIAVIDTIRRRFEGRIGFVFGVGTNLTNDLGLVALNIVMKATHANGTETVKLSDNSGKHTGSETQVNRYKQIFNIRPHQRQAVEPRQLSVSDAAIKTRIAAV